MSSRSLGDLRPDIHTKAVEHMKLCLERGVDLLIYCTYRDEYEQARLYRKNRSRSQIAAKMRRMADAGFPRLAQIIEEVGPQNNEGVRPVTYAGPGESAHQYRVAYDCVPLIDGKAIWSTNTSLGARLWGIVTNSGREVGLEPLNFERPHFQLIGFNDLRNDFMLQKYGNT